MSNAFGRVDFFNNVAGWGKITGFDGQDYFVHHSDISDPSFYPENDIEKFRTLRRGQGVMFVPVKTDKPMSRATKVVLAQIKEHTGG